MRQRITPRLRHWAVVGLLVALLILLLAAWFGGKGALGLSSHSPGDQASVTAEARLQHAFEARRDDFWVEASGRIVRVLPDDLDGSRHQRIIVALATGQTLLIAHNIDLAPRIESLEPGGRLGFRGEYVWNARGGVIHWTHHDPGGNSVGGWLEYQGRRYR
ncbi:DUF3465 domain-containing protein [Salinicola acroporae]|uniref:DUF3465 domain-containing protein n=1 Tax=Salinicola acroporae TaxID=1541440 RepID=A0ABT6I4G2_9GAMM|nr:DUF3465 domain-containing protein [Salinicola acroporae]MDH4572557.1 hypothetical protein [Salinicola acroporae]